MALTEDFRKFLEHPHIARLAVIDDEGYPHVVLIWYALDGEDLIFFSSRTTRKVVHAQANPKGAVTIGGDPYGAEGFLLKGELSIEEDRDNHWMGTITHRYEPKELADKHIEEWGKGDLVLMRLKVANTLRV
jgi:general stress protein 26